MDTIGEVGTVSQGEEGATWSHDSPRRRRCLHPVDRTVDVDSNYSIDNMSKSRTKSDTKNNTRRCCACSDFSDVQRSYGASPVAAGSADQLLRVASVSYLGSGGAATVYRSTMASSLDDTETSGGTTGGKGARADDADGYWQFIHPHYRDVACSPASLFSSLVFQQNPRAPYAVHDGATVAVKVYHDSAGRDGDPQRDCRRVTELTILSYLSLAVKPPHPHLMPFLGVLEHSSACALPPPSPSMLSSLPVLEYAGGGAISAYMGCHAADRIGADVMMRWLLEAASALDCLHAHGVVHRDVKPANLLLSHQRRHRQDCDGSGCDPGSCCGVAGACSETVCTGLRVILADYDCAEVVAGSPTADALLLASGNWEGPYGDDGPHPPPTGSNRSCSSYSPLDAPFAAVAASTGFCAPEVASCWGLRPRAACSPAVDVYGLGVTFYTLLLAPKSSVEEAGAVGLPFFHHHYALPEQRGAVAALAVAMIARGGYPRLTELAQQHDAAQALRCEATAALLPHSGRCLGRGEDWPLCYSRSSSAFFFSSVARTATAAQKWFIDSYRSDAGETTPRIAAGENTQVEENNINSVSGRQRVVNHDRSFYLGAAPSVGVHPAVTFVKPWGERSATAAYAGAYVEHDDSCSSSSSSGGGEEELVDSVDVATIYTSDQHHNSINGQPDRHAAWNTCTQNSQQEESFMFPYSDSKDAGATNRRRETEPPFHDDSLLQIDGGGGGRLHAPFPPQYPATTPTATTATMTAASTMATSITTVPEPGAVRVDLASATDEAAAAAWQARTLRVAEMAARLHEWRVPWEVLATIDDMMAVSPDDRPPLEAVMSIVRRARRRECAQLCPGCGQKRDMG